MDHTPPRARHRTTQLLRLVLLLFGGQILVLYFVHFLFGGSETVFQGFRQGLDFGYFHTAARAWLAGRDPYTVRDFVTPPLSLLVPALLARLSLARATFVFLCCNAVLLPLSLWWYSGALRLQTLHRLLFLAAAAVFISAQESARGGNMDTLILALLIAAFCAPQRLRRAAQRYPQAPEPPTTALSSAPAIALAAAIAIKLYPILLLPVAIRRRQWRFAALTIGALVIFLLPFFPYWHSALHALFTRNARFAPASIAPMTLFYSLAETTNSLARTICFALWAITFAWALYRDKEFHLSPLTLARYTPWMLAWPALVFSYQGVLALTVLASLLATAGQRPLRAAERASFIGFLLLGIHIEQVTNMMPLRYETYLFFRLHSAVVQSFGVVLMIFGTTLAPSRQAGEALDESGKETALARHPLSDQSRSQVSPAGL